MKEKYKDQVKIQIKIISKGVCTNVCPQDDEERELRMKLLQSSGAQDEEAKGRKKKKENRGLEKLYGKSGTGDRYYVRIKTGLVLQEVTKGKDLRGIRN